MIAAVLNRCTNIRLSERRRRRRKRDANEEERTTIISTYINAANFFPSFFLLSSLYSASLSSSYLVFGDTSEELTLFAVAIDGGVGAGGVVLIGGEAAEVNGAAKAHDEERGEEERHTHRWLGCVLVLCTKQGDMFDTRPTKKLLKK